MTGIPYVPGSDTSEAAAQTMERPAPNLRERVARAVAESGFRGMTCDEVESTLELRHQTASARLRELVLCGRIVDSNNRRATRSGRYAAVYCLPKWLDAPLDLA